MQPSQVMTVKQLLQSAIDLGLIKGRVVNDKAIIPVLDGFATEVMKTGIFEHDQRLEACTDEHVQISALRRASVSDESQYDYVDINEEQLCATCSRGSPVVADDLASPTCFSVLCKYMGFACLPQVTSVCQLDYQACVKLSNNPAVMIGYSVYGPDDHRNHVVALNVTSKKGMINFNVHGGTGKDDCVHGVVSPHEFFNSGGRFYRTAFYASNSEAGEFGGDLASITGRASRAPPPAPESVVNDGANGGSANLSGGVMRPGRRSIKARGDYDVSARDLRNYSVVGVTMFNNGDELLLNTISRIRAQEIMEDLFEVWGLPTDQSTTMKYAEDLLWTFMIARTASNKADYRIILDIPTKSGVIEADFDKFSRLLADKHGITRRNFARGVADDLREFLCRSENQFFKSRVAQRIGADPQMGGLCFDGSTGCSGLTSAEASFTRLLEAKNLYERDDVIAEGASDKLMQGIHGGVRSIVPR